MKFTIFTLCDFAQDVGGKLTIVGIFNIIYSKTLPASIPTCWIAARINFSNEEIGEHSMKLVISDENDKEILPPITGKTVVQKPPDGEFSSANLVIGVGRLSFSSYGKYFLSLFFDDKLVNTFPFFVKKPDGQ